ncbi:uroporphyrinogen-III synthase [Streptomyces sp. AJS327]|nr:uroporphyrinogen-III synthase [Streptomyces sp. AJS327]
MSGRSGPGGAGTGPLAGYTVGVTAARRADDLVALLERRGAEVVRAPALRTVPLDDDTELLARTRELLDTPPDVVVATTAVGFRGWMTVAERWGVGSALLERLDEAELLARGPKVRGAVRAAGLRERWSPASESLAEVVDRLLEEGVSGRRIALQLHGEPVPDVEEALRAAGAEVLPVPVYRWLPPHDPGPVDELTDAVLARSVDALTFTSAPAVVSLLDRAEHRGLLPELLTALRDGTLPVCVGPVTAAPLERRGVPSLQPERYRLAPMVDLLCAELTGRARRL